MSVLRIFLITLILFQVGLFPGYCASYYVSSSTGRDDYNGLSPKSPWKSLKKVGNMNFLPGDAISLKRGDVWAEQLTISSSGTVQKPIMYGAFGKGANPLIKTSDSFVDFILFKETGQTKIWKGSIKGVLNYSGAVKNGQRIPRYYKWNKHFQPPSSLEEMRNGYFYAPLNKGEFYFRNDSGKPAPIDVGTRKYGIFIYNKQHVIIDNIDISGPGGSEEQGNDKFPRLVVIDGSAKVSIQNCTLSNHFIGGADIRNGSRHCVFLNVISIGHGGTGLYFSSAGEGNKAVGCKVYNCGNLDTDYGDMGLIGIWKTHGVVIEKCVVGNNGHEGIERIDAAVSFVQSPHGMITRSHIKNTGATAIQFAENSDFGTASYNIIDSWGNAGVKNHSEGIRIGGGYVASTARGCKIFNNLFINGGKNRGDWAALKILNHMNEGLQVKNNIFYNNIGIYEIIASSADNFIDWSFSNNIYFSTGGNVIKWAEQSYNYRQLIGNRKGFFSYDKKQDVNSLAGDPKLLDGFKGLSPDSPCIGNGVDVGLSHDFYGNHVPRGTVINIGPFQKLQN